MFKWIGRLLDHGDEEMEKAMFAKGPEPDPKPLTEKEYREMALGRVQTKASEHFSAETILRYLPVALSTDVGAIMMAPRDVVLDSRFVEVSSAVNRLVERHTSILKDRLRDQEALTNRYVKILKLLPDVVACEVNVTDLGLDSSLLYDPLSQAVIAASDKNAKNHAANVTVPSAIASQILELLPRVIRGDVVEGWEFKQHLMEDPRAVACFAATKEAIATALKVEQYLPGVPKSSDVTDLEWFASLWSGQLRIRFQDNSGDRWDVKNKCHFGDGGYAAVNLIATQVRRFSIYGPMCATLEGLRRDYKIVPEGCIDDDSTLDHEEDDNNFPV